MGPEVVESPAQFEYAGAMADGLWVAHVSGHDGWRNHYIWLWYLASRHLRAYTSQRQPILWWQCGANATRIPSVATTTRVDEPISVVSRIHELFLFDIVLLHTVSDELSASLYCIYCKYNSYINLQLPTGFLYETTKWQPL
jgi:hypothetical protein